MARGKFNFPYFKQVQVTDRQPRPCAVLLLPVALLVSACSGSGNSDAIDLQSSSETSVAADITTAADNVSNVELDENTSQGGFASATDTETESVSTTESEPEMQSELEIVSGEAMNDGAGDLDLSNPVVPDPLNPTTILASFDITVPAYKSDQLRVEVDWGYINLNARWIGDEYWEASGEFPTEVEHPLIVTFYDRNGDIELAKFSQDYRTGSNATESFKIGADQLDSNQFDNDGDGRSNLDELIQGSDPEVHEDSYLEVKDSVYFSTDSRMSIHADFESQLSDERPLVFSSEVFRYPGDPDYDEELSTTKINIDAQGNGTYSFRQDFFCERFSLSGTRSRTQNSVSWDAGRSASNCDYNFSVKVSNTITLLDNGNRTIIENLEGSNVGTYQNKWEVKTDLTAQLNEETSLCNPIAGRIYYFETEWDGSYREYQTIIEKEIDQEYWTVFRKVSTPRYDGDFLVSLTIHSEEKFFARELITTPYACDFVDL